MTDQPPPETYEEHVEHLRGLIDQWSDIQFELGRWLCETLDRFHLTQREMHTRLADDINISYSTMNDWIVTRRFWKTEDLPGELTRRIAWLYESLHDGTLNYSHFRKAKRVGSAQADSRVERVEAAVVWLEHVVNGGVKQSMVDAEVAAIAGGEEFTPAVKVFDSREHEWQTGLAVGYQVEKAMRTASQEGKEAWVVVYAEGTDG